MTDDLQTEEQVQTRLKAAAVAKAEAEARQAGANADQAETAAAGSPYSALVPDLSKVQASTFDLKGNDATVANGLAFAAVTAAGRLVADKIRNHLGENVKVVVTSDADFVKATATYANLKLDLEQLALQAEALLERPKPYELEIEIVPALALGSAVASALPGILSLFAHHETLTSTAVKPDDLASASAVIGALLESAGADAVVMHDTFRRALPGVIDNLAKELLADLSQLQQVTDPDKKPRATALIKSISAALGELTAVPKGGTRSPLVMASVAELMDGDPPKISHALLLKGQPGSASELTDTRAFGKEHVLIATTMSITYILVDASSSHILVAGTESATIQAHGKIDEVIKFETGVVVKSAPH